MGPVTDLRHTVDLGTALGGAVPVPLKLVVVAGPEVGREVALAPSVEIGAEEECDLVLTDRAVSGRHARVKVTKGIAAFAAAVWFDWL